jgi:hypothetical protein
MVRLLAVWLLSVAIPLAAAQAPADSAADSIERAFAPGGRVTLNLSAGEYSIRPGVSSDKIRLRWSTRKPESVSKIRVNAEVHGSEAVVTARGTSDLRVEVDIPERTDLSIKLTKGDLEIRGIDGNKAVDCRRGDITISIEKAADFKQADFSVRLGDIQAPPFGVSKGGFCRSAHWQGSGKYTMQLRARMGSITVIGK